MRVGILAPALFVLVVAHGSSAAQGRTPITPQERLNSATTKLTQATTDEERFYALNDAAKQSFVVGKIDEAAKYARDLQSLLPKFRGTGPTATLSKTPTWSWGVWLCEKDGSMKRSSYCLRLARAKVHHR